MVLGTLTVLLFYSFNFSYKCIYSYIISWEVLNCARTKNNKKKKPNTERCMDWSIQDFLMLLLNNLLFRIKI